MRMEVAETTVTFKIFRAEKRLRRLLSLVQSNSDEHRHKAAIGFVNKLPDIIIRLEGLRDQEKRELE
jgi:hypothetical protein